MCRLKSLSETGSTLLTASQTVRLNAAMLATLRHLIVWQAQHTALAADTPVATTLQGHVEMLRAVFRCSA